MSLFMNSGFIVVVFLLSCVRFFCDPMDCSLHRVLCPWAFPGKSTGVGFNFLLQGIFLTRYWTHVSCIDRLFFFFFLNPWVTRKALDSGKTDHLFGLFHKLVQFSSVQSLSRVWLFATPWITAHQASLSITKSQSLPKLMSIKSVMSSSHLILCRPLLFLPPIPPSIRVFSSESTLRMRWPKYWNFSFSISPSNEHSRLISFRMDWLDLLAVQRTLRIFSNTTVQKHQFFGAQLSSQSNSHIHTWPLEKP